MWASYHNWLFVNSFLWWLWRPKKIVLVSSQCFREAELALAQTKAETLWRCGVADGKPLDHRVVICCRSSGPVKWRHWCWWVWWNSRHHCRLAWQLPLHPFRTKKFMHLGFHIYDVWFPKSEWGIGTTSCYATALLLVSVIALLNLSAVTIRKPFYVEKYKSGKGKAAIEETIMSDVKTHLSIFQHCSAKPNRHCALRMKTVCLAVNDLQTFITVKRSAKRVIMIIPRKTGDGNLSRPSGCGNRLYCAVFNRWTIWVDGCRITGEINLRDQKYLLQRKPMWQSVRYVALRYVFQKHQPIPKKHFSEYGSLMALRISRHYNKQNVF